LLKVLNRFPDHSARFGLSSLRGLIAGIQVVGDDVNFRQRHDVKEWLGERSLPKLPICAFELATAQAAVETRVLEPWAGGFDTIGKSKTNSTVNGGCRRKTGSAAATL